MDRLKSCSFLTTLSLPRSNPRLRGFRRAAAQLAPFFVFVALLGFVARGGSAATVSVAEAARHGGSGQAVSSAPETLTVMGVLTSDPVPLGTGAAAATLQDETGGIALYAPHRSALLGKFHQGDLVQVTGTPQSYEGHPELGIEEIRFLGKEALPKPREVLAVDLQGTRFLGQLVRLDGLLVVSRGSDGKRYLFLRDRSGEIPLYVAPGLLAEPELPRHLFQGGRVQIVGIATRYTGDPALPSGYELAPRAAADFQFVPEPPYAVIGLGVFFLFSLLGFSGVYLFLRRRAADRRAAEMRSLLNDLERSRDALSASEKKYRLLFENSPLPMWICSPDSLAFLAVNGAAVQQYGHSRDEFLQMTVRDLGPQPDLPGSPESFLLTPAGGEHSSQARHRKRDGGWMDVEITSHEVEWEGQPARLVLAQDITARNRLEEQLRQAQKMEAVGRLSGGIAHDFNNLLGVILGYGDVLEQHLGTDGPALKTLEEIQKAARRAASLTRRLLAFSRSQIIERKALNLNTVVHEIGAMLHRVIGEDIEFRTVLDPDLAAVKADQGQIEQLIMNLVVNARDAMPKGGQLALETRNADLDDFSARQHPPLTPGSYVLFSVTDTGIGMDAETKARIFEPFFTSKPHGTGTGLGLATVYAIVEQCGGSISVYSEPGMGATFKIYFPRLDQTPEASQTPALSRDDHRGTGTILLVEDEEALRTLTRSLLEGMGYAVLEAESADRAIEVAKNYPEPIRLLLTDVVMPGIDGRALSEHISSLLPEIRVLFMSGYPDYAISQHGALDSGVCLLAKPFTRAALAGKLSEVLTRSPKPPEPVLP
jgi:PAS domain S-box-containing protein